MSDLVWTAWRPGATYVGSGINMHGNPPKYKRHVVGFWPVVVIAGRSVSIDLRTGETITKGNEELRPLAACGSTAIQSTVELKPLSLSDVTCKRCAADWRIKGLFERQSLAVTRHLKDIPQAAQFREQLADNTPASVLAFADWLEDRGDPTAKFLRVIGMADLDWQSAVRPHVKVTQ